ncbi:hypothetical protein FRC08_004456 [Ceratobasidium sp. 394]|nr:hypothetical protein FRC08_004456 [Ceratobasidium sp. 394]KAG9096408.1 hypothetical protein FS749_008565 [Ceratobasidium sp. UAMH 11750]
MTPVPWRSGSVASLYARPPPWSQEATAKHAAMLQSGQVPPVPAQLFRRMTERPPLETPVEVDHPTRGPSHTPAPPPFRRQFTMHAPSSPAQSVRRDPAAGTSREQSGFSYAYGRSQSVQFPPMDETPFQEWLAGLQEPSCPSPVGMLQSMRAREVQHVLRGAFLRPGDAVSDGEPRDAASWWTDTQPFAQ